MSYRLSTGGQIDRSKPLNFHFDGKRYSGFAGDTFASALIANGVHLVGRSFKYRRPRGFLSAGTDEPNALVAVGSDETRIPMPGGSIAVEVVQLVFYDPEGKRLDG